MRAAPNNASNASSWTPTGRESACNFDEPLDRSRSRRGDPSSKQAPAIPKSQSIDSHDQRGSREIRER